MKYLKIQNNGELDIRLIALMGGTTKADDPTKIGTFGTGLKYAISYLVRNDVSFYLFVGENEIEFTTKDENISGKDFKEIYCNGKSMNITTHYGYQWQAWEAIREIWCNATDEDGENKKVIDQRSKIVGTPGKTTFYIETTPAIQEVLDKWDEYFFTKELPLFENDKVAIYKNSGENLRLYKNGVLIQSSTYYDSLFVYDFKEAPLNELRQYQGFLTHDIATALLKSNKAVIRPLVDAIKDIKCSNLYEVKMDWSYISFDSSLVKLIFSGNLYLHPQSVVNDKSKGVRVNQSLFNLLSSAGVPTERITMTTGGSYGGGGLGYSQGQVSYKEILNPELQARIEAIAIKYGSSMKYTIAIPIKDEFEILINGTNVVFNSALETQAQADLEATVLIGIFHSQENNMYKAFRRLIKFAVSNKNFRKILFGRNILDKIKPEYQPPSKKIPEVSPDDLLPF